MFKLKSKFKPTGDQPKAINRLVSGISKNIKDQVLLGVTGSGKTFSIANVIQKTHRPTLVISHNKTLAAQLYQEFRDFFPDNAVEYFVSYYDYYQPESYVPQRDLYIEKDAAINEEIDRLRLKTTTSLMSRSDVIVVASVSCIYNLGSPSEYRNRTLNLRKEKSKDREEIIKELTNLFYVRSDFDFKRGTFRVVGDTIDVYLAYEDLGIRINLFDDSVESFDPVSGEIFDEHKYYYIYPAKHYLAKEDRRGPATYQIRLDMEKKIAEFKKNKKNLEAYRLEQRTKYDLEMIKELGYCKGIENYSRYFDGRKPGDPPYTLLDFFDKSFKNNWLTIIDESHITVPQIRGMHNGDKARKETLIDYGFRLPSALDNRPLTFDEFHEKVSNVIFTSATPGEWEVRESQKRGVPIVEQLIRPTGLLDPKINIFPTKNQIPHLIGEIKNTIKRGERVLITTLTKRMAEELSKYLEEQGIKVNYLHSDIETLDRSDILENLRKGKYDVVVGINLLREGLDLPEVSLIAILDADKEGFLRSDTSLIQIMGRAARHISGKVIMYADNTTGSMKRAIKEVERRRNIQIKYNKRHGIDPKTITKPIRKQLIKRNKDKGDSKNKKDRYRLDFFNLPPDEQQIFLLDLEKKMKKYADKLDFEKAAIYRDELKVLKKALY